MIDIQFTCELHPETITTNYTDSPWPEHIVVAHHATITVTWVEPDMIEADRLFCTGVIQELKSAGTLAKMRTTQYGQGDTSNEAIESAVSQFERAGLPHVATVLRAHLQRR